MPHVAPGWLSIYDPQPRAHYEIPLSSHFTGTPKRRVSAPPPRRQLQDFCITLRHGVFFLCFAGQVSPALAQGFFFFYFTYLSVVFLFEILVQMSSKKKQKIKANPVSRLKLRNGLLEPICTCMSTARLGWINKNPVVFDNPVDSADLRIRSTAMQKSCFTRIAYR